MNPSVDLSGTDVSTGLHVQAALHCRGLASELGGLCSFEAHQTLATFLLKEFQWKPLPGYSHVTIDQLQRADKHLLKMVAELTSSGLTADGAGKLRKLPADYALAETMRDTEFRTLLLSLPTLSSKRPAPEPEC